MRKLQQVALVVAAAGGLSTIGSGVSSATPVGYGAAPPPVPQPDNPQAHAWSGSQATSSTSGSYAHPQQSDRSEMSPQVNPQLSPQLNPDISPQATPPKQEQNGLFRPFQECSPGALLDADLPVALLAAAQSRGVTCHQHNHQANAFARA